MQRSTLSFISLCLLLLLGGCQGAAANEAAPVLSDQTAREMQIRPEADAAGTLAPVPSPGSEASWPLTSTEQEEEDLPLGYCISIRDNLPCSIDLDGDGEPEIVDMITQPGALDGCPRWTVSVKKGAQERTFQTDILEDMPFDLWVGDLDEDGSAEIFFHGDEASDDYIVYAWRSDLTPILFEPDDRLVRTDPDEGGSDGKSPVFSGYIEGFEDGHIVIEGVVDMLGTHWGVRTFAIGDDGIIGPVSSVWSFEEDDRYLTVAQELTAYGAKVARDPGEAFTLTAGEKVYPLASDGCARMWFKTGGGKTGVLLLTPDEDGMVMWRIDGAPEAEFFEFLPYSG